MVIRRLIAPHIDFSALRRELKLPSQFSPAAQREADAIVASGPAWPALDRTDIAFVTIDPPTSMDLDQAMCLERRAGGGYRVYYAIADVSAFVTPGGALEAETWERGQTVYLPDGKVPLHPTNLSEGVASLLPDQARPAVMWTIDLDADGGTAAVRIERAAVRSRAKLNYPAVAAGGIDEPIALLPEIGKLLVERGLARGAINLPIAAQDVEPVAGGWELVFTAPLAIEEYNAQISLLTGMAAAQIMLDGKIGLLRTMPRPDPGAIAKLKAAAVPLGIEWPDGASAGRVIGAVDGGEPRGAAFLDQAAELMRGAGYTAFDGPLPALAGARWCRRAVCARDRAAAPPGRPVCHGDLCRAVRRGGRAGLGPGGTAEASRCHDDDRPRGQRRRARRRRPGRGRAARGAGGGAVRRGRARCRRTEAAS